MLTQDDSDYENGYRARGKGLFDNACPFSIGRFRRRAWWMAGFNDHDIKIKNRKKGIKDDV